jgi:16S rRNA (guanine966-N2)-methyltransferase
MIRGKYDLGEMRCLDLFAGTGNITFELASEGCPDITSVDVHDKCVSFIRRTSEALGENSVHVFRADVFEFIRKCHSRFDLIFADPPFDLRDKEDLWKIITEKKLLNEEGVFILEHQSREQFSHLDGFRFTRAYGNVSFSFFSNFESDSSAT